MQVTTRTKRPSAVRLRTPSQSSGPPGPAGPPGSTGGVSIGSSMFFASRQAIAGATIPSLASGGPAYILTTAFAPGYDMPLSAYKRRPGAPPTGYTSNPGWVQSVDGQWWELLTSGAILHIEQFGGRGDYYQFDWTTASVPGGGFSIDPGVNGSPTDNYGPFVHAMNFVLTNVHIYSNDVNLSDYPMGAAGYFAAGPTVRFGYGTFYVSNTIRPDRTMTIEGMGSGYAASGAAPSKIFVPGDKPAFDFHTFYSKNPGSPDTVLRNIYIKSLSKTTPDVHGILMHANVTIEHATVTGFSGRGITGDADVTGGTNSNLFNIFRVSTLLNDGDGVYLAGGDANAGAVYMLNTADNGGYGLRTTAFLANTYIACHAAGNGLGAYYAEGVNAPELFLGCYSEGGQPDGYAGPLVVFDQGLLGAGMNLADGSSRRYGNKMAGGLQLFPPGAGDSIDVYLRGANNTLYTLTDQGLPFDFKFYQNAGPGDEGGFWGLAYGGTLNISHGWTGGAGGGFRDPAFPSNIFLANRGVMIGSKDNALPRAARWVQCADDTTCFDGVATLAGDTVIDRTGTFAEWRCTAAGGNYTAWTTGSTYAVGDFLKNSANRLYQVTTAGGGTSTVQPVHTSGTVTGADGYAWRWVSDDGAPATWRKFGRRFLEGTATQTVGALANGASSTFTITVTGASTTDYVEVSCDQNTQGMAVRGRVTSSNTVTVRVYNDTGSTSSALTSANWYACCRPKTI